MSKRKKWQLEQQSDSDNDDATHTTHATKPNTERASARTSAAAAAASASVVGGELVCCVCVSKREVAVECVDCAEYFCELDFVERHDRDEERAAAPAVDGGGEHDGAREEEGKREETRGEGSGESQENATGGEGAEGGGGRKEDTADAAPGAEEKERSAGREEESEANTVKPEKKSEEVDNGGKRLRKHVFRPLVGVNVDGLKVGKRLGAPRTPSPAPPVSGALDDDDDDDDDDGDVDKYRLSCTPEGEEKHRGSDVSEDEERKEVNRRSPLLRSPPRSRARYEPGGARTILIRDFSSRTTIADLRSAFKGSGSIVDVQLPKDHRGRLRGDAFIEFDTADQAKDAVYDMDGEYMGHRRVSVQLAHVDIEAMSQPERRPPPPMFRGRGGRGFRGRGRGFRDRGGVDGGFQWR